MTRGTERAGGAPDDKAEALYVPKHSDRAAEDEAPRERGRKRAPTWLKWGTVLAGTATGVGLTLGALNDGLDLVDRWILATAPSGAASPSPTAPSPATPVSPSPSHGADQKKTPKPSGSGRARTPEEADPKPIEEQPPEPEPEIPSTRPTTDPSTEVSPSVPAPSAWVVEGRKDGINPVFLMHQSTQRCLTDVAGGDPVVAPCRSDVDTKRTTTQHWEVFVFDDDSWQLKNFSTGECLAVAGNDWEIVSETCAADAGQAWARVENQVADFGLENGETVTCLGANGVDVDYNVVVARCSGVGGQGWN